MSGARPGAGAGPVDGGPAGTGAGTGRGTGPGTGPGAGAGTGQDTGAGTGRGTGPGTGPGAGRGTGQGIGAGTGPAAPAGAAPAPDLDPITFEVVRHRLSQINDEQGLAIKTISASPIVVEGNDFNVGLFTADGRLVTAGIGSLVHVTTLGTAIRSMREAAEEVADGDVLLTNDPYLGALHQNDVVVASPLFVAGRPVLWVGNVLHYPDVGGIDEGSFCINARNLYQEPPRYFLKVVERGRLSAEVEHTFVMNSRLPDAVALDLRAQVGAIHVAKERLRELIAERGVELVTAVMEASLRDTAERLGARIRALPDGDFQAEVFMDGDRVGSDRIHRVAVRLSRRGSALRFDYTGSDPQVDAAVNCTYHACYAAAAVPVYTFLCGGEIDWNDGLQPCVEVTAPEGSVVNARFPAPVSISTVGFRWLATAAAAKALALMLDGSEAFGDRACASWTVSSNVNNVFGLTADGRRVGALLSDHRAGGAAARSFADGFSHAGQVTSFASHMGNVENAEYKLPLLYLFRRALADSGGPGRHRGGLTAMAALVPYGADQLVFKSTNTAGTDQSNAAGLAGGYPGAGSQVALVRGSRVWDLLRAGTVPRDLAALGGHRSDLPSKADGVIGRDDVFAFYPPGGGGYGDPLAREPERVLADVAAGLVSPEAARELYGVVRGARGPAPTPGRGAEPRPRGDAGGPAPQRSARRRERLAGGREEEVAAERPTAADRLSGSMRFERGGAGDPVGGGPAIHCAHCGGLLAASDEAALRVVRREEPLRAAGPWLAVRWAGQSPNFHLETWACPSCGGLLRVEERRSGPGAPDPAPGP